MTPDDKHAKLEALVRELAELRASIPAHSTPASLRMRIEDLEDEIAALRADLKDNKGTTP